MKVATLSLAILLLIAGCRESAQPASPTPANLTVTFELMSMEPQIPKVGTTSLDFLVLESGAPLANAQVAVRGDMNHAGMVPVDGLATTGADGIASVPFEWTMGGDWIITVTVTTPDGLSVTGSFDMQIPV